MAKIPTFLVRNVTGRYFTTITAEESVRPFVPHALPPNPLIEITGQRQLLLVRATLAVGRLDSISKLILLRKPVRCF